MAVLLRRRGMVMVATMLVSLATGVYAHLKPLTYTTSAAFRPQGSAEQGASSLMLALANQFGVNVGGGAGDEASPHFYRELLASREILTSVSDEPFTVSDVGSVMLKDLLKIEEESEALRDEAVLEWLGKAVSVATGSQTGTVTISVKTRWPDLSVAIAAELMTEVALFNMDTRQSQAAS